MGDDEFVFKESYSGRLALCEALCERYFWFLVLCRGYTQTHIDRKVTFGPNVTCVYITKLSEQGNLEPCRIWMSYESSEAFI